MPVAFRAVGPRLKVDIASASSAQTVQMPPGHAAGDLLLLVLVHDANTNPLTAPSGWTLLGSASAGTSVSAAAAAYVQTRVYYRVAPSGTTPGAAFTFSKDPWPAGSPYVLAFTAAYSGVDPAGPIEKWAGTGTANTAPSQAHPPVTTVADGDWLLTLRTGSAWSSLSTTVAGGVNTERVDDTDGFGELFAALYDSGAALAPGAQAQRTTTAAGTDPVCYGGSTVWSLAVKATAVASVTYALPGTGSVAATAYGATVATQDGPWDLCGEQGLPSYLFTIDWDGLPGALNTNAGFEAEGGWTAFGGASFERSGVRAHRGVWSGLLTAGGAPGPRFESDKVAVAPDRLYRASGWVWAESAMPGGVSFSVNWYGADGAYLATSSNFFTPAPQEWRYADGFFPAPSGAAFAGILLDCGGTPAAGLRVWGDEVRLDDWSALADPSAVVGAGESVTDDIVSEVTVSYGRDQDRRLSPAAIGSASFTLNNSHRRYSPENITSPLHGDLDPARPMRAQVSWAGQVYPLFKGRVDDFTAKADRSDRTADFTFLDDTALLQGVKITTEVLQSRRTGELINYVLDMAGWTGPRDIDPGATVVRFWWANATEALNAIQDLVLSEGPPAVAYQSPDGTFVFRDRHHRMMRERSLVSQGTFTASAVDCATGPAVTGLNFTPPFTYTHGWKDIINSVSFQVEERGVSGLLEPVWQSQDTYTLSIGQSLPLTVSGTDPFIDAQVPVAGVDYTASGPGVLRVYLNRTSGTSVTVTLVAVGGTVQVSGLQLRAKPVRVVRSVTVSRTDPGSVGVHGERTYPNEAPWASAADAAAIADMVLLHYTQRRPTVQLRVVTEDPAHFVQVLQRTVGDRIHIRNDEAGLDDDFFIERVQHTVRRFNAVGRPPVHAVIFGCEKHQVTGANPFRFDVRGAGFDQGTWDPVTADSTERVFIFDDPVRGQFDIGEFGT